MVTSITRQVLQKLFVVVISVSLATSANAQTLAQAVAGDYPYLEALFKHFHANPELSLQENETSDRLASELQALGYTVTRGIAQTGLVGIMKNGKGPTVMIRADMDGLPVVEKSGLAYASKKRQVNLEGKDMPVMHACGHDVHITSLIGTARRLAAMKDRWRGTVMLLGQPAEEAQGGAERMIKDRLYERVGRPDYALALHVEANEPAGKIVFNEGLMYSSADTVKIIIEGVGTHGASPHLGKDPVVIGSQIVLALQTIVTREISPLQPAIITVGAFHAGTAPNVISDQAVLDITVRANSEETRALLLTSIDRIAKNTGRMAGLPEDRLPQVIVATDGVPTTINDAGLARRIRGALIKNMGEDALSPYLQSDMGAEDFPMLVRVEPPIPSVYFMVGGTSADKLAASRAGGPPVAGHHSPLFVIEPEPSIKAGVEAMTIAALELLGKP